MYKLIEFPEIQDYQELDGFEEHSHVCVDIDGAVFVDISWIYEQKKEDAISMIAEGISELNIDKRHFHTIETEWEQTIPFEGGMTDNEAILQIAYNNLI